MDKRIFIAAGVVGVAILLFAKSRSTPDHQPARMETREEAARPGKKAQAASSKLRIEVPKEIEEARRLAAMESKIGLTGIALPEGRHGGPSLAVNVVVQRRCSFGDVDAILQDLKHSDRPSLIMTVEPIDGSGFRPLVRQIGRSDLDRGFRHTFELPDLKKPEQIGLFICKDSDRRGRCGGKPVRSINDVFEQEGKQRHYKAADTVYYFQYMILDKMRLQMLASPNMRDEQYGAMKDYLAARDVDDKAKDNVGKVRGANKALTSAPLTASNGRVTVTLPRIRPECDLSNPGKVLK